jgi:Coenzyme PQQ synthesis protein D (PqqD)
MLRLADHVRSANTPGGAVILDVNLGRMYALNPTASRIVGLLKRGAEEEDITLLLARECGIAPETAERDVFEFLTLLRQHTLIQSCP